VFAEFARPHELDRGGNRGLGWGIERGSKRAIGHNGFTGTYLRVELSRKMYIVLLTNAVHPTRNNDKLGPVRRAFLDSVLQTFDQSVASN
jgi:CubicO group peptidase (beta-lactamase class C family)